MIDNTRSGLQIESLTKTFGSHTALDNVSLSVPAGCFASILGPSGCGKTTLLMLVAGLEKPDRGRVLALGEDITDVPVEKRGIGLVFQSYALFPNLTVSENILYGLRSRKAPESVMKERLEEMLELTFLTDFRHRMPRELSGGQQQRVAIARALAPRPRLLLLDEPLSALDAWSRSSIGEQLRRIQQAAGVTTVMVTHDRREALSLSDYVVVMNAGRIEQAAPAADIYDRPSGEFVATFVGDMNIVRLAAVRDGSPTGIRYADVRLHRATEASLSQLDTFVGQVQGVQFMGDAVRVRVLLNDFQTVVTADALRAATDAAVFAENALIAVELPRSLWRSWGPQ